MEEVEGVVNVHDLHVWSLGSNSHALACHVTIADIPPSESACILVKLNHVLRDHFQFSTLQFSLNTKDAKSSMAVSCPLKRCPARCRSQPPRPRRISLPSHSFAPGGPRLDSTSSCRAALCLALLFSTGKTFGSRPAQAAYCNKPLLRRPRNSTRSPANTPTRTSPTRRISFYVQDGKLIMESERMVPTALTENSPTEFAVPDSKMTLKFTLDAAGRGATVFASNDPQVIYKHTGDAVHHLFHDYQRTEVMIPMRDGVKLHTVILKPADITTPLPFLIQRTPYGVDGTSRASFFGGRPELARDGYIYVAAGHSRPLQERRRIRDEPSLVDHHPGSPQTGLGPGGSRPQGHRRKHRHL